MHRLAAPVEVGAVRFAEVAIVVVTAKHQLDRALLGDEGAPHGLCGDSARALRTDAPGAIELQEAVGGQNRDPIRVGGQHLRTPVEDVLRGLPLEVEDQEVAPAGAEQREVVHVATVGRIGAEEILAQVAAVGGRARNPGFAGIPRRREVGVVLGEGAGGVVEIVVAGDHGVGDARVVQHAQSGGRMPPLGEVHILTDEVAQLDHHGSVQRRATVHGPLGLLDDRALPVGVGVVLHIGDGDEGERITAAGARHGRPRWTPLEPDVDSSAVRVRDRHRQRNVCCAGGGSVSRADQ